MPKDTQKSQPDQAPQPDQNRQKTPEKPSKFSKSAKIANLEAKNSELLADLQRIRADFENFRKQTELQRDHTIQTTRESTVAEFLPLLDDLERAITAHPDELGPLAKNFEKTLADLNLTKVDSAPDTEFNPDFHEAVSAEGDGSRELIAATLRPGYLYDGHLIRPALVKVIRK